MPRPQRPNLARAPRPLFAVALLCAAPAFAAEPPQPGVDLDGRWLGTAGGERDRVAFGVEIARGEEGATELRLTLPVANFYGVPAWGEVRREGARVTVERLGLELELVDGRLVGSFPEPGSPVALDRVAELPAKAPWTELPAGPEPLWRAQLGAPVFASPTVADGVVYVGTTGGLLLAVDAGEGGLRWAFRAGRPIHGTALVAGDALYFVCDDGHLYKLARADGAELWRYDLGDARVPRIPPHPQVFDWDWQAPTPALADGVVYVGSGDGSFHAVDAATGARRWRFETGGKVRNGAAIDGARVIFGSADRNVYALDRASGRELWRHDAGGEIDAAPVVVGEHVLVAARGAGLQALATATGETLWSHPFWTSWVESTPVVADGVAYVGSSDLRRVTALDPADGRVLWRTDVGGWSWGTPLLAGDRVYAAAAAGNPYSVEHRAGLVALDRTTGRPLWRHPLDEPEGAFLWGVAGSPVRAGDTVIVATAQGALLAFPAERGNVAGAPTAAELAGVWAGVRRFGPVARGTLTLERRGSSWHAEIAGFRVEAAAEESAVAFELPGGEGSFRGRLEPASGTIHGQWIQPGVTAAFGQRFSTPVALAPAGPGRWIGEIRPLTDEVHLYLVIEPVEGGRARAFLRNPEVNFGRFFGPLEVRRDGDTVALRGTLAWQPESEPRELLSGVFRADRGVLSLFVEDLGGTFDLERLGDDAVSGFHPRPPLASVAPLTVPATLDDGWATASPEAVGLAPAPLAALVEKLATTLIDAVDAPAIDALLVARHGKLVVEEYFHDHARERAHDVRSASKSLTATLAGAAIHDGAVELSTPVYATYDGGTARAGLDRRAARMTLEHLLAMDSGLPCDDWSSESPGGEDRIQSQSDEPDWHRLLLDLPMAHEPGEHAAYCSVGMSVVGELVARALGEPLTDAFDRLLGRPLEMSAYHTNLMPNGAAYAGGGLRLTARDFLKFGQLLLDDGVWNGHRILDPGWTAKVLERRHDLGNERLGTYTMGWWLLDYDVDGRKIAAFYAGGNGGNYILGVPEFDLAVVFQASNFNQSVQHRTKREDVPAFILRSALGGALPASPVEPEVSGTGNDSFASGTSRVAGAAEACPAGMVGIPAGTFEMGSDRGKEDEKPPHSVTLPAFCIDRTEVTVAAYAACVAEAKCSPAPTTADWPGIGEEEKAIDSLFCNGAREDRLEHPINCVDWRRADAYCRAVGKRLPTEEEWEYAARGTDGRTYPWGDAEPDPERLNTCDAACVAMGERLGHPGWESMFAGSDGWESTAPVGSYPKGASAFGVLDMAGNVWEMTSSGYSPDYRSPRTDEKRVYRGGGWGYHVRSLIRTANRGKNVPEYRGADLGFRCARTP